MIYSARTNLDVKALPWVYAHGELETFLGFDCIATNNVAVYTDYQHVLNGVTETKQIVTMAKNDKGEVREIVIYLWFNRTIRGLAVDINDSEAITYAQKLFETQPAII